MNPQLDRNRKTKIERCKTIIEVIKTRSLTAHEMAEVVGVSRSTAAGYKDAMLDAGLICNDGVTLVPGSIVSRKVAKFRYCGDDSLFAEFSANVQQGVEMMVSQHDSDGAPRHVKSGPACQIGTKPDLMLWLSFGRMPA